MQALRLVLLTLAAVGTVYHVLSTLALRRHFRKPPAPANVNGPRVSVLKPVSGVDRDARDNFLSYLRQDHADYEVLFGILDRDDPAVSVVLETIEGCDRARLLIGSAIDGSNNKVRVLDNLAREASGEILVITDADTRVTADFLSRITAPFRDARVGAVTCMYRGVRARSVGDALEGLHMTCAFAPGVAAAEALGGIDFGLGAAIAVRRNVLDEIGGFEAIVDYLADDFQLCHRAAKAGYRVVLSDYVVDVVLAGESLRGVLARELRWSRTTRVSRPRGHLGLAMTFGFPYALWFLFASGLSGMGWGVLGAAAMVRCVSAWYGARVCLGDREVARRMHLLPLRDVLSFGIWVAGYLGGTVKWRGRMLRLLKDGRMMEVKGARKGNAE